MLWAWLTVILQFYGGPDECDFVHQSRSESHLAIAQDVVDRDCLYLTSWLISLNELSRTGERELGTW